MRAHVSWVVVLAASGAIATACAADDSNKTKISRPDANRGGTANGSAGRGNGGTTTGLAGGGGDTAMGMAGDNGAGTGAQPGSGGRGGGVGGGAGQSEAGAGGTTGGNGGRGGSSGSGGASNPGGNGGEAGEVSSGKGLYIGLTGSDTATGARPDPYATLSHAASVATSGDTIIFLDGTFDFEPGLAIAIADGVNIVAENPGQVTLNHTGGIQINPLVELTGASQIDGIAFVGFATSVRASSANDDTVTITNSRFSNCANAGYAALDVLNTATVVLSGAASTDWGNCPAFATVADTGTLTVTGGILHYISGVGVTAITLNDESTLNLSNVTATDGSRPLLLQYASSTATITDSTIRTLGNNVVTLKDESVFTLTNSDLSIAPTAPYAYACIQNDGTAAITLVDSYVHHCSNAINGAIPSVLTVDNTEIYAMSFDGIEIQGGNSGVINITDSNFHDTTTYSMRLFAGGGGNNIAALTLRNTIFTGAAEGLRVQSAPGSTTDLGTMAEPGGNTLTATTTSLTALTAPGTFITAVGNTWVPDQQGADSSGHYTTGPGTTLEVSATTTGGRNYSNNYGSIIRLAQSP